MKLKLLLTAFLFTVAFSNSYASFPVERTVKTVTTTEGNTDVEESVMVSPAAAAGQKSQGIALLLWFFLGGLAAHRWYLGSPWYWNVLFTITLGGLLIWAIVDLIDILTGNYPAKGGFKSEFF
jgi:TM2 domain-containing membrane protein YozV